MNRKKTISPAFEADDGHKCRTADDAENRAGTKAKTKSCEFDADDIAADTRYELAERQAEAALMSLLGRDGAGVPMPFSRDILLMETQINGCMHVRGIHKRAAALKEGDIVKLVLEPDNRADKRAILIRDPKDKKLGYIPRVKNEVLFHLMDAGKKLYGKVVGGDIGEKLDKESEWINIYIEVYMKD